MVMVTNGLNGNVLCVMADSFHLASLFMLHVVSNGKVPFLSSTSFWDITDVFWHFLVEYTLLMKSQLDATLGMLSIFFN